MNAPTPSPADEIEAVALAIAARYPTAPAEETNAAIALLVLWLLDALDAGRLSEEDASIIMTGLWSAVTEHPDGPDLADAADELLFEGGWLHDEAIGAAPDRGRLRDLARSLLGVRSDAA